MICKTFVSDKFGVLRVLASNGSIFLCADDLERIFECECRLKSKKTTIDGENLRFITDVQLDYMFRYSSITKAAEFTLWVCETILPQLHGETNDSAVTANG